MGTLFLLTPVVILMLVEGFVLADPAFGWALRKTSLEARGIQPTAHPTTETRLADILQALIVLLVGTAILILTVRLYWPLL